MRMYDIIEKKRDGGTLTDDEIGFFIAGYTAGTIPDYQASALLMAIFLRGMNNEETCQLTLHMMQSGAQIDLSSLPGTTVDKHSTGGVGDKTSLIVTPMLAAMDPEIHVPMMSGRGLGHTGGTLDKLESIPDMQVSFDEADFLTLLQHHGAAIVSQTENLAPADRLLYALRDVTATVDSIPLIASSIMSKKLAEGTQNLLLDVKVGSGAFMKTLPEALELAKTMVAIGTGADRNVEALITNMDRPLGRAIGNTLEIVESVETLQGHGPQDLADLCLALASHAAALTRRFTLTEAEKRAQEVIANGSAFEKLCEMIEAQGGDSSYLRDTSRFETTDVTHIVTAPTSGYISAINTELVGIASCKLGAGREKVGDPIDHRAGITLFKTYGNAVEQGEAVAILYASDEAKLASGRAAFEEAISYSPCAPDAKPLLIATVTKDGVALS